MHKVRKGKTSVWMCLCDCGTQKLIPKGNLTRGMSKSCGCGRGEQHGMSGTLEYHVWSRAKLRCNDPKNADFPLYGARGIKMCSRWSASFIAFFADMGKKPKGTTIDRIDNDGNYEPNNCRWATAKQQANNRRSNTQITANNETHTIAEWANITGISQSLISQRIRCLGWSQEKTINTPVRKCAKR